MKPAEPPALVMVTELVLTFRGPAVTVTPTDVAPPLTSEKWIVAEPILTGDTENEPSGPVLDALTVATPVFVLLALMVPE